MLEGKEGEENHGSVFAQFQKGPEKTPSLGTQRFNENQK